jgi:adenylate kinase
VTKPSPLIIVLFGAQGSGKGTQARLIQELLTIPQVATGDLFRHNLKNDTELGKLAKGFMDKGNLVPDSVTNAMVQDRLNQADAQQGVILDGYPRNIAQAQALDAMLTAMNTGVKQAIYMDVPEAELLRRLTGRWVCRVCQSTYHVVFNPPKIEGVCDRCGGELYQRDDDKDKEAIHRRLQLYFEETMPVIHWYEERGLLGKVNGDLPIEEVNARIKELIGA